MTAAASSSSASDILIGSFLLQIAWTTLLGWVWVSYYASQPVKTHAGIACMQGPIELLIY